jgi:3' exoribonuclease, RNase T-like
MRLFLDTEFTDLIPGNKLISIALVSEIGKYFYAELTDTYERNECSDFVMQFILPLLKGGEYEMTSAECALKLATWIEEREVECVLGCDNPSWDLPHFRYLMDKIVLWPVNLIEDEIFKFQIMDDVVEDIVVKHDLYIHNALDDAKVMMLANQIGEAWEY